MMLLAALAASVAVGPALKLGPANPDGTQSVLALDSKGRIVAHIVCLRNEWTDPEDSAVKLMSSTKVAAIVLAKDGRLTELDDLGPAKYVCVIAPGDGEKGNASAR